MAKINAYNSFNFNGTILPAFVKILFLTTLLYIWLSLEFRKMYAHSNSVVSKYFKKSGNQVTQFIYVKYFNTDQILI